MLTAYARYPGMFVYLMKRKIIFQISSGLTKDFLVFDGLLSQVLPKEDFSFFQFQLFLQTKHVLPKCNLDHTVLLLLYEEYIAFPDSNWNQQVFLKDISYVSLPFSSQALPL